MNLQELRIGNYIDTGDFYIKGLKGVYQYKPKWWKYVHLFKPIPLTEQWLKDFGARKGKYMNDCNIWNISYGDYEFNSIKIWQYGKEFSFNLNFMSIKLPYVHKLQNLYFALTEKELTKQ